jgi:uncharacterized phage-associated protein
MNLPNNSKKSTQVVARLIEASGGPIDYLRIAKLVYLADRESIFARGVPIVGGHYYSMRKGPTIGEVMTFVNTGKAPNWKETILPRVGNKVGLKRKPQYGALSKSEMDIIDSVVKYHSTRSTDELVEWCHVNCPEFVQVEQGRKPIEVEEILKSFKKSPKQIQKFVQEAEQIEELDEILA